MSLWAVKDADGWFWDFTDEGFYEENDTRTAGIPNRDYANQIAKEHNGTLTEYVQKPAPVVVSEAEAKILEGAKKDKHPCMYIAWKVQVDDEDRLMRAYVSGCEVKKSKWFRVKIPHTEDDWYWQDGDSLHANNDDCVTSDFFEFTESDIEHYGLTHCEREEVTDDAND